MRNTLTKIKCLLEDTAAVALNNILNCRDGNAEQAVSEPEPEDDQQPREPGEGLQQEEVAHPLSSGEIQT
jgi:hypothetical protein